MRFLSFWVALIAFAGALWLNRDEVSVFHPTGDDFSLIARSSSPTVEWLTSGYSKYFAPYPEYWEPFTNFIRPITNVIYYLCTFIGGPRVQLVVVNFGVLAATAALVHLLAIRLGNSAWSSIALAACAFLTPAFWGSLMVNAPAAAFDGVAALEVLAALWLASEGRWRSAWIILLLAVFTKESALPIVAAFVLQALVKRRALQAAGYSLIVVIWVVVRLAVFGQSVGIYIFGSQFDVSSIAGRASAVLWLPVTYGAYIPFRDYLAGSVPDWRALTMLLANIVVLLGAAVSVSSTLRAAGGEGSANRVALAQLSAACVACYGAYFGVISGGVRFAYVFYVALLVLLATAVPTTARRVSIGVLLAALLLATGSFMSATETARPRQKYGYDVARQLMAHLRAIGPGRTVHVANDIVSGYSSMDNVAAVAGARVTVRRAGSIDVGTCSVQQLGQIRSTSTSANGSIRLTTTLPSCASYQFEGTATAKLRAHTHGNRLERNQQIEYVFPAMTQDSWGPVMTVTIHSDALLYFDFEKGDWVFVE